MNSWGRQICNRYRSKIYDIREKMEQVRTSHDEHASTISKLSVRSLLETNSKIFQLKDGDINSKFLHSSASAQKKANIIPSLTCGDGTITYDHIVAYLFQYLVQS